MCQCLYSPECTDLLFGKRKSERGHLRTPFPVICQLFRCAFEFEIGEDMGDPSLSRDCPLDCKVYVGNLGNSGNKTELERAFGYYGPLRSVWVARNPPGFAFVEFEDPRDATDAVRELDGRTLCGCRVRVEMSSGEKRSRYRGPPPSWNRRPRDDYRRRSPPARRRDITKPLLIYL
ncbi:serine/arginine-rich splicing factor 3a isoform X3 [Labeo rohita]|uniref:serine/arginine-rich splicing factor 3a isoform X3 n=1 Tax=Labeo rohita TaxID=84645 RepID=UPI0021E33005|nr:serine/arginine-rich splicing factor 3a isoform X3 [Labeo rohita]